MTGGNQSIEYFEKREKEEREAASRAQSEVAREIHSKLADEYAAMARQLKPDPTPDSEAA